MTSLLMAGLGRKVQPDHIAAFRRIALHHASRPSGPAEVHLAVKILRRYAGQQFVQAWGADSALAGFGSWAQMAVNAIIT